MRQKPFDMGHQSIPSRMTKVAKFGLPFDHLVKKWLVTISKTCDKIYKIRVLGRRAADPNIFEKPAATASIARTNPSNLNQCEPQSELIRAKLFAISKVNNISHVGSLFQKPKGFWL